MYIILDSLRIGFMERYERYMLGWIPNPSQAHFGSDTRSKSNGANTYIKQYEEMQAGVYYGMI